MKSLFSRSNSSFPAPAGWSLCGLVAALLAGGIAHASDARDTAREAERLLSGWQQAAAARVLAPYESQADPPPDIAYVLARLAFVRGQYAQAEKRIDEALKASPDRGAWQSLRAVIRSTRGAVAGYHEARSKDGRVVVRYEAGKDAVLVPFVLLAMDAIVREIGGDFGFVAEEPILVELYPSAETLAKVSPLTEKDIERTGTIALCKYQRLMVTTPRALLRGYAWLDTLAHEFVHYAVTKLSNNTVPIWLHEGLAKWEERRWRGAITRRLQPTAEHLLAQGLQKKKLITFEQMHPSMAKLPSQEDAGLAFAEVYTVIDYIHGKVGLAGIREVLGLMRAGKSDADAIAAVMKQSFAAFKKAWMAYLRGLKLNLHPGIVADKLHFKKKGKKKRDELRDITSEQARDFTRLGEHLRQRNHVRAAAIELGKAVKLAKNRFPMIQNKLARVLLDLREPREAVATLLPTLELYPSYPSTHLYLGEAYLALGEVDRAITAFEETIRQNPFNPRPHEALWDLYRRKNDAEGAERAARSLRVLKGESGDDPWAPVSTLP